MYIHWNLSVESGAKPTRSKEFRRGRHLWFCHLPLHGPEFDPAYRRIFRFPGRERL